MTRIFVALGVIALLSGCSARQAAPGTVLATNISELQPLGDRDHFVYVWQRLVDGEREADGIHVEHVTALPEPNEFEIAISQDGVASGRIRVRHDDTLMALIEEDDFGQGIRLSYAPPLPELQAPVVVGETSSTSTAEVRKVDNDEALNSVEVLQKMKVAGTHHVESAIGNYDTGVSIYTRRTLQTAVGAVELESAVMLVPGVGEIRSEGRANASQTLPEGEGLPRLVVTRRELACAIIGGKPVGDCRNVAQQLEKLRSRKGD